LVVFLIDAVVSGGDWLKQKTRDWLAIAGFLKFYWFWLEISPHVAGQTGDAMPNRHLAINAHSAHSLFKRGVHFLLTTLSNPIPAYLSNID
jgi:hypothetical protein